MAAAASTPQSARYWWVVEVFIHFPAVLIIFIRLRLLKGQIGVIAEDVFQVIFTIHF